MGARNCQSFVACIPSKSCRQWCQRQFIREQDPSRSAIEVGQRTSTSAAVLPRRAFRRWKSPMPPSNIDADWRSSTYAMPKCSLPKTWNGWSSSLPCAQQRGSGCASSPPPGRDPTACSSFCDSTASWSSAARFGTPCASAGLSDARADQRARRYSGAATG